MMTQGDCHGSRQDREVRILLAKHQQGLGPTTSKSPVLATLRVACFSDVDKCSTRLQTRHSVTRDLLRYSSIMSLEAVSSPLRAPM